ncbi:MAG TPA: FAD-dependent oxidoreductase, partial [Patescibacteria group bacterium]|nr:FAD-dependent oxidoreductase [Patescibacteria group bacterium]
MHAGTLGSLSEAVNCDICVIGGGFSGLSAAFELSLRGFSVIILEKGKIASAASGKNGGQMQRGFTKSPRYLIDKYGRDDAKLMCDVSVEGIKLIQQRIADFNIDCGFKPGVLVAAFKPSQLADLQADTDGWTELGYHDMHMLDAAGTQNLVHVSQYIGSQLDEVGGHFHPYNYAQGLAHAAISKGCRIYDLTRVTAIEHWDNPRVITDKGEVRAKYVILGGAIRAKGVE